MERLTEHLGRYIRIKGLESIYSSEYSKTARLNNAIIKLAAYEDTGLTPEEIIELLHQSNGPLHKKLGQWLQAEQEGRLAVLPCKVGDTIYVIPPMGES